MLEAFGAKAHSKGKRKEKKMKHDSMSQLTNYNP